MINLANFIWVGGEQIPHLYQQCLNSFVNKHPHWTINIWRDIDCEKIINDSPYKDLFNKHTSFINRYNFIKYHILAQEGGWFIDMDIQWNRSIEEIYNDKITGGFPELFVPVRSNPMTPTKITDNDDNLIYAEKGLFNGLLYHISQRGDIDTTKKYEPFGPVSLSQWVHKKERNVIFLYEEEIQLNGYYCNHLNGESWRFS
ncbi:glycosyltransferase [bacterium]|nr:glycosyltransferase [bacterium]